MSGEHEHSGCLSGCMTFIAALAIMFMFVWLLMLSNGHENVLIDGKPHSLQVSDGCTPPHAFDLGRAWDHMWHNRLYCAAG